MNDQNASIAILAQGSQGEHLFLILLLLEAAVDSLSKKIKAHCSERCSSGGVASAIAKGIFFW